MISRVAAQASTELLNHDEQVAFRVSYSGSRDQL